MLGGNQQNYLKVYCERQKKTKHRKEMTHEDKLEMLLITQASKGRITGIRLTLAVKLNLST